MRWEWEFRLGWVGFGGEGKLVFGFTDMDEIWGVHVLGRM